MNIGTQASERPASGVHLPEHLGKPVEHGGEEGEAGAAEHDVVEVADDEVGVVDVDVDGQRALHEPGQAADGEEEDEGEGEEHGRPGGRWSPCRGWLTQLKTLMALGMATMKVRSEKTSTADVAHAAGEHVVAPDQGADGGDGQRLEKAITL